MRANCTNLLDDCCVTYDEMHRFICGVVKSLVGSRPSEDLIQEMIDEGWIIVLEKLKFYEPNRGIKATTFVWTQLNGRLSRYIRRYKRNMRMKPPKDYPIHNCVDSIFETNPYNQTPELVYLQNEQVELWHRLRREHNGMVQKCLNKAPRKSADVVRKSYSRCRRRCIRWIQIDMKNRDAQSGVVAL